MIACGLKPFHHKDRRPRLLSPGMDHRILAVLFSIPEHERRAELPRTVRCDYVLMNGLQPLPGLLERVWEMIVQ